MSLQVVQRPDGAVAVEGDLAASNADEFARRLLALDPDARGEIRLDLRGLDFDDGPALAIAITVLRQLSTRASKLILIGAAQMLCHNLYRVGLLGGHIELVDMREDEPAGF